MWWNLTEQFKHVTVRDMYNYAQENNLMLLADAGIQFDFWAEYLANSAEFDKAFDRYYKTFYYFDQEEGETVETVYNRFIADIKSFLRVHSKRYSELYRIHVISDEQYSVLDNYDITETKNRTRDNTLTDNMGQRVVNDTVTTGAQSNISLNEVTPFDEENFYNNNRNTQTIGQRADTDVTTSEAVQDTHVTAEEEDYTLRRKGNIGVQTQSEVMQKHVDFWNLFDFYKIVFDDMCKELLLIDKGYIV